MRPVGRKLGKSQTQTKYSVSNGAGWILKQDNIQLPMLDENILDFYHFGNPVIQAVHVLFGEGGKEALAWKEKTMGVSKNQDSPI